jgi:hypothetical protein
MAYNPGDILLVRDHTGGNDLLGNLILAAQRARYGYSDCARWTHAALIVSEDGDIVEATAHGIERNNLSRYEHFETLIITPSTATLEQRQLAVEGALAQVGTKYDVLDFIALGCSLLMNLRWSLHSYRRFICSGLVARYTEKYIATYPYPSEAMMPADLGHYYGAISGDPLPPISLSGQFLDKFRAVCWGLSPFNHGLRP